MLLLWRLFDNLKATPSKGVLDLGMHFLSKYWHLLLVRVPAGLGQIGFGSVTVNWKQIQRFLGGRARRLGLGGVLHLGGRKNWVGVGIHSLHLKITDNFNTSSLI